MTSNTQPTPGAAEAGPWKPGDICEALICGYTRAGYVRVELIDANRGGDWKAFLSSADWREGLPSFGCIYYVDKMRPLANAPALLAMEKATTGDGIKRPVRLGQDKDGYDGFLFDADGNCITEVREEDIANIIAAALNAHAAPAGIDVLVNALEMLSKLGNGDRLGNSEGNRIAQAALVIYCQKNGVNLPPAAPKPASETNETKEG